MISASVISARPAWSRPSAPAAPAWIRGAFPLVVLAASAGMLLGRGGAQRRVRAGEGFAETILPHLDSAYSLARYLARDPDAAEDIVQDAVLKAHRGFAGFRGGDAKAWLLTIVRRQFIDWSNERRAGRAVFSAEAGGEAWEDFASEDDTPEQSLLRQGDVGAVRRAIEALPEPFREAIVLRELESLSYGEIAIITGAPVGTVMSRLSRGRDLLAARLKAHAAARPAEGGGR